MKPIRLSALLAALVFIFLTGLASASPTGEARKPPPDEILDILIQGNQRFASGKSTHPHTDADRLAQAGSENQGNHALATVITCSDSRVPVEMIFDMGIMDVFVVRVAGNVCNTDEIGSIEYGLAHVHTPVLVVLGHTQCGAVTAVTEAQLGQAHKLERNIPPLIAPIVPAVKRAIAENPDLKGDELVEKAIVENVWQGIRDLFMKSPATRELVDSGKVKVVGAIYDVGAGKINWLPEEKVKAIMNEVKADPNKATNPYAGE